MQSSRMETLGARVALAMMTLAVVACGSGATGQSNPDASIDASPSTRATIEGAAIPRVSRVAMPTPRTDVKAYRDFSDGKPEHPTLAAARAIGAKDKWLDVALAEAPKGLALEKEGFVSEAWENPSPTDWSHIGAVFPHQSDEPLRISPVRVERWAMSLRPVGVAPVVGELDRGRVVYRDAVPHGDLIAMAREREVEELFLLRDEKAPTEFHWSLELGSGLTLRKERLPDGSIDFLDGNGDAALRIRAAYVVDAAGTKRDAKTTIEGSELVVRLDPKGLAYPVLLDPVAEVPIWQSKTAVPIPISSHTLTYSQDMATSVLVGGAYSSNASGCTLNNTSTIYSWNGSAWSSSTAPSGLLPRLNPGATQFGAGILLFGGSTSCGSTLVSDTWVESGGTFRQICANGACGGPAAQVAPGMAYLSVNATLYDSNAAKPLYAFEGCWADGTAYGRDLPVYEGNNNGAGYTPQQCSAICKSAGYAYSGSQNASECWCGNSFGKYGRSASCTYTCTADATQYCGGNWVQDIYWTGLGGAAYLFGSSDQKTWVWGNGASGWAQFPYNGQGDGWGYLPAAREGGVMVADPNAQQIFLFGGYAGAGTPMSDGWLLTPAASGAYPSSASVDTTTHWQPVCGILGRTPCGAPARTAAQGAYDSNRKKIVIYGGNNGAFDMNDTWEFDAATSTWTALCYPTCSGVGTLEGTWLAYDPARRRIVLAGGYMTNSQSATYELYVRGGTCSADADCDTGHCFGGTCCESVCTQCQTCSMTGKEGTCQNIAAGNPDPVNACPSNGQCNGAGACKTPVGQACSASSDCALGYCVNGYCCSQASCAAGLSCSNASGGNPTGQCLTLNGASCTANSQCSSNQCVDSTCCGSASCPAGSHCNYGTPKLGSCLLDDGRACTSGAQCGSGNCVDGVCCNTACNAQCQACDVAGSLGTCVNVTGAVHPNATGAARTPCTGAGTTCGSSCNGSDGTQCYAAPTSTSCGAPSCAGGTATLVGNCTGSGSCSQPTQGCGNYTCGASACKTSCTVDTDCASAAYYCSGNACVLKQPNGNGCSSANACASGNCVGGLCCDSACTGTGFSCNLPTSLGHCAKAKGTACGGNAECGSGFCVDGVCCDSACNGQCQACDVQGVVGTCSPVAGAPHGGRTACSGTGAGTTCGPTCNGTDIAACHYPTSTTNCGASTCIDGTALSTFTQIGVCNGAGSCAANAGDCGTYKCGGTACKNACAATSDCQAGNYCKTGFCVPIEGLGVPCTDPSACPSGYCTDGVCCASASCGAGASCDASTNTAGHCEELQGTKCSVNAECASGHCVDGFCCDSACTGSCEACGVSGKEGTCVPVVGQPVTGHPACSSTPGDPICGLSCNGTDAKACHYAPTTVSCGMPACGAATETDVTTCDGGGNCPVVQRSCGAYQCGATTCLTACKADADCAAGNFCKSGTCVAAQDLGNACSEDLQCATGHCTDGVCCSVSSCGAGAACAALGTATPGKCLKANAITCTGSSECGSGHCVDGVCCDKGCDGQCEACDVKGSEGSCTPVTGAPHDARPACDALAANDCAKATCDGATRDKCTGFANGTATPCGKTACTQDGQLQNAGVCDGHGTCSMPSPLPCKGYFTCDASSSACKTTCASDADCQTSFRCDAGTNTCVPGATCSADRTQSTAKDGTVTPCAPYLCGGDGVCLKACATSDDCVSGTDCDDTTHACIEVSAGATTTSSGGCDVGGAPGEGREGLAIAALVGLGLVATRRRRR